MNTDYPYEHMCKKEKERIQELEAELAKAKVELEDKKLAIDVLIDMNGEHVEKECNLEAELAKERARKELVLKRGRPAHNLNHPEYGYGYCDLGKGKWYPTADDAIDAEIESNNGS